MGAKINVLSAGAVKPALTRVIDAFRQETGHAVDVTFATAPEIRRRLSADESADVVIAPSEVIDELVGAGNAQATDRGTIGRIGIGIVVRDGAAVPSIATVEDFKQSLLATGSIVYNQASTGIYLEQLFERLGIGEHVKAAAIRYPDAASVLEHVRGAGSRCIGFAAVTVVKENEGQGLKFVGPLPAEIQNYTTYEATATANSARHELAPALVRYLTTSAARAVFAAFGIESNPD
ncbi:MAG TPA: substrate-binding domain-containing protein [Candidatus Eisenbacteria bacterium]|nr:substrate-binding domain-containing protein [Candidatus Eisenbacteria bacterium]